MKKLILILALFFTFSTAFVSCRENKKADDVEDVADDIEDSMEDMEDEVEDTMDDTEDMNDELEDPDLDAMDDAA